MQGEIQAITSPGVRELALENFRNYASLHTDLLQGLNVLVGANAQGKTNFLEAIYLLSTTRLLRGMRDAEAVREGSDRAVVSAELQHTHTQVSITLEQRVRKRASLNGMSLPRAADLIGRLPSVCISTADLPIVRGEPADRRMFLDLELSQLRPAYLRDLTLYKRALEQRNALLRASQEEPQPAALFEPWESQIAEHGASLRDHRKSFIAQLSPAVRELHSQMSDGESFRIEYNQRDDPTTAAEIAEALERTRPGDIARSGTSVGPHRDDVAMEVGGRDARLYGSQGQQRTAVIALKLATLRVAEEELGAPPMLLLDDILSDLDERRRAMLVELVLGRSGQAVLTCTEASAAGQDILNRAKVFVVEAGMVREP
ncbi:MAG: DNA replication/repair protein RecF [Fimbriimonadaceae bacterium]